jgi:signal transduction histidine kinase
LALVERRTLKQNSTEHSLPQSLGAELAAVSADFLDINQMPVESQVDTVLRRIGSRVEAERSYVFQIDHEGGTTSNTHEWTAAGVSPEIDNLQNLPLSAIPWWMKKLKQHETITIPDVSRLPAAAEAEQEILEAQNIQSVIVSPMISEGELIGFIGFDWTEKQEVWSEDFVHILRLYAEVIISAIQVERERELQAENERLDRFASVVSHDLRNPLSAAKGWAEAASNVLAENDPDIDMVQTMLTDIADAHQRMDVIITDLLTLARSGQTIEETQSVDITTVAGEAWKTTNTGDSVLELSVDAGCTVPADPDRLLQVFENLFRNAIEHNDSPVQVTVGLPAEMVNGEDNPSAFFVEDTGCGIPGSQQDAVFDSGETTAAEGTGLGLSIVQSIVDAHGWDITVTDSTDGGARFVITDIDSDSS